MSKTATYYAYQTKNGQAVKMLRKGTYENLRAWADKQEARNYAKTQIHNPIWVDCMIYAVPR